MSFKTQQEEFWAGQFGTDYISRNKSAQLLASNHAFFSRILGRTHGVESVLEIGANVGMNIRALKNLLPEGDFWGVEINKEDYGFVYHGDLVYPQDDITWFLMKRS